MTILSKSCANFKLTSVMLPSLMIVFFLVSSQDGDCSPSSSPVLPPVDCKHKSSQVECQTWQFPSKFTSVDCRLITTPVLRLFSLSLRRSLCSLPFVWTYVGRVELNWSERMRMRNGWKIQLPEKSRAYFSLRVVLLRLSFPLPAGFGLSSLSSSISSPIY